MSKAGRESPREGGGVTRRDVLRVGGVGALGLALGDPGSGIAREVSGERALILLLLVGGPSQLETWDPKPHAPLEVRGPFGTIATRVPGVRVNEHLPRLARRMDRLTLIRSLHHDSAPIHETGLQLLQTGRLCLFGSDQPHVGSVAARLLGPRTSNGLPTSVVLPTPLGNTGVAISHGQSAGTLGQEFESLLLHADPADREFYRGVAVGPSSRTVEAPAGSSATGKGQSDRHLNSDALRVFDLSQERGQVRDQYGRNTFGQSCLLARRLVEAGVRVVTVNMFETVFDQISWDCHGSRPFSTLEDYKRELLPTLDTALAALVDDLSERGRLDSTLVVATGEFGRTPRINAAGGRDHWPGVWSAVMAGGGTAGGQVIGASDAHAVEPTDRPVTPPELLATIYRSLGIDASRLVRLADGLNRPTMTEVAPVVEVFA